MHPHAIESKVADFIPLRPFLLSVFEKICDSLPKIMIKNTVIARKLGLQRESAKGVLFSLSSH